MRNSQTRAFTLVELLVVMSIISVLVTLVGVSFRSAQVRGRDAQRKSDLKQLANSLELFFADYGKYPASDAQGRVLSCPYVLGVAPENQNPCDWGSSEFKDSKVIYFKKMPIDSVTNQKYFYRCDDSTNYQTYQLFARLENPKDQDCISGTCETKVVDYQCGVDVSQFCNYALTSFNTKATE